MSTHQATLALQPSELLLETARRGMPPSSTCFAWARWALLLGSLTLAGCDKIGLSSLGGPSSADVRREAEGRAIGGACRHAGRAIEDCFTLNRQADKAAVFAGWREMNDYMAEKNMTPVPAAGASATASGTAARQDGASGDGR